MKRILVFLASVLLSFNLLASGIFDISPPAPPAFTIVKGERPAIYLSSTIERPDAYTDLIIFISSNHHIKDMDIYLSGNGGSVASVLNLINVIRDSPTNFRMVVYGDVYSGHAVIAMNGDSLVVQNPNIIFLFHIPAVSMDNGDRLIVSEYCKTLKGMDRGVKDSKKCFEFQKKSFVSMHNISFGLIKSIMTEEELKQYWDGEDVLIIGGDIISRLNKK